MRMGELRIGFFYKALFAAALVVGCASWQDNARAASVWKVSNPAGNVLYLGGSFHALRPSD